MGWSWGPGDTGQLLHVQTSAGHRDAGAVVVVVVVGGVGAFGGVELFVAGCGLVGRVVASTHVSSADQRVTSSARLSAVADVTLLDSTSRSVAVSLSPAS